MWVCGSCFLWGRCPPSLVSILQVSGLATGTTSSVSSLYRDAVSKLAIQLVRFYSSILNKSACCTVVCSISGLAELSSIPDKKKFPLQTAPFLGLPFALLVGCLLL